jgi:hypothetical protein
MCGVCVWVGGCNGACHLSVGIELRICWPFREFFQALAHLFVPQNVEEAWRVFGQGLRSKHTRASCQWLVFRLRPSESCCQPAARMPHVCACCALGRYLLPMHVSYCKGPKQSLVVLLSFKRRSSFDHTATLNPQPSTLTCPLPPYTLDALARALTVFNGWSWTARGRYGAQLSSLSIQSLPTCPPPPSDVPCDVKASVLESIPTQATRTHLRTDLRA